MLTSHFSDQEKCGPDALYLSPDGRPPAGAHFLSQSRHRKLAINSWAWPVSARIRHTGLGRIPTCRGLCLVTPQLVFDALADLKRIHSHICSVAYPVLEAAGELPALGAAKDDMAADAVEFRPKLP